MQDVTVDQYNVTNYQGEVSIGIVGSDGQRMVLMIDEALAIKMAAAIDYNARPDGDELLSPPDVGKALGINARSVHQRISSGSMPPPDIEVGDPRSQGQLRWWWHSTLVRGGVLDREAGEGDFVGLFMAIVFLIVLLKGCGIA